MGNIDELIFREQHAPKPQGLAEPSMSEGLEAFGTMARRTGEAAVQYGVPAILPTLGQAAGAAATPMMGGVPGAMAGGAIGEGLNQLLGITEPSGEQIGLAAVAPAAARALMKAGQTALKLSGSKGVDVLNKLAYLEGKGFVAAKRGAMPVYSQLFKEAEDSGILLQMHNLDTVLNDIKSQAGTWTPSARTMLKPVMDYVDDLAMKLHPPTMPAIKPSGQPYKLTPQQMQQQMAAQTGNMPYYEGTLTPTELQHELEYVGKVLQSAEAKGGSKLGLAKRIYGALASDLDDAASMAGSAHPMAGAEKLKGARQAYSRAALLDDLDELIDEKYILKRGVGPDRQFNANQIMTTIKQDRFYERALDPQERIEFEALMKQLNKFPAVRTGAGQDAGSLQAIKGMVMPGAIGGSAGAAAGGPGGAALGMVVGMTAPKVAQTAKHLLLAWSVPHGRALVKQLLLGSQGRITPEVSGILGAFAAAQAADPGSASWVQGASE